MKNTLKEKLARGEKPLGTFVNTGSAAVVECLGCTGLDFVILDNEHSPIEAETTATLVRAAECRGLTPLARVREISRPAILKLLDVRGFCPSRKDAWGTADLGPVPQAMSYFNSQTLLIPQCETAEALAEIEAITALPGVDGIFIGPFDLSISLGIPGEFENPAFRAALPHLRR